MPWYGGPPMGSDVTSDAHAEAVARHWSGVKADTVRSFWQSPIVRGELNRRITGDPEVDSIEYFRRRYCGKPFARALSLGSGQGHHERALIKAGVCEHIIGVDVSPERVEQANAAIPRDVRGRLEFVCANLETWEPEGQFDLIVAKAVLHHLEGLERWAEIAASRLQPGGLVYVDEFVGARRFQWSKRQMVVINRLLACLPPEMRLDLTRDDGALKERVGRPSIERFVENDPSEAIRSDEVLSVLSRHLDLVELRPYGGGVYHQLFSRIMGNFEEAPEAVRLIMEIDAILTEYGVLESDYAWAVYRAPGEPRS